MSQVTPHSSLPEPLSDSSACGWKVCCAVAVALTLLAAIAITVLLLTKCSNYYTYGAAGVGVLSLILIAISSYKIHQANKQIADPQTITLTKPSASHTDKGLEIIRETLTVERFSPQNFKEWLLEGVKDNPHKQKLFESTLLKFLDRYPEGQKITLTYQQVIQSKASFEQDLKKSYPDPVQVNGSQEWYDYTEKNHSYIDFANAFTLGGGWRTHGFVMEEVLFFQFFDLALWAYVAHINGRVILPATGNPASEETEPTPFIVPNLKRQCVLGSELYAKKLYFTDGKESPRNPETIPNFVSAPPAHEEEATIIGIAARCWKKSALYTKADLIYHLKAAYLAFMGEKAANQGNPLVITGAWGCGAFNNSEHMMVVLQLLAAKMAGVEITFTGLDNPYNPNYTAENLKTLTELVNAADNPQTLIDHLLGLQTTDPKTWAPKTYVPPPPPEEK